MKPSEELKAKELLEEGYSYYGISKLLGIHYNAIRMLLDPDYKLSYKAVKKKWIANNSSRKREWASTYRKSKRGILTTKLRAAFRGFNDRKQVIPTVNEFIERFGLKDTYKCYLTERDITLSEISLDHVTPVKKSRSSSTINDIEITDWKMNKMKGDLSLEEFVKLCKLVAKRYSK